MKAHDPALDTAILALVIGAADPAYPSQDNPQPLLEANLSGLHDFDLRAGRWRAHHRRLKEPLAGGHEWTEFEGTCAFQQLMGGWANMDDNVFDMPGGVCRGVTLRAYDAKSGEWAIWWLDGRNPCGDLAPPVKGRFENGIGIFYADDPLGGRKIRVRCIWSHISAASAHWEQAFSADGGWTWETNWITAFRRMP